MKPYVIALHILSTIITIGATAISSAYLVKGLVSHNKKDFRKMFIFIGILILTIALDVYFLW